MSKKKLLANVPHLDELIREVRGQKIMLDFDLALVYGVETKSLNRAVKRNADRFPKDFMFQITRREFEALRYQIGTSSSGHGGRSVLCPLPSALCPLPSALGPLPSALGPLTSDCF